MYVCEADSFYRYHIICILICKANHDIFVFFFLMCAQELEGSMASERSKGTAAEAQAQQTNLMLKSLKDELHKANTELEVRNVYEEQAEHGLSVS